MVSLSCEIGEGHLTRPETLKSQEQEDNRRVFDTALACQVSISDTLQRQGDSQRVIHNRFTCPGALRNQNERQGDNQRSIDYPSRFIHK